LSGIPQVELEWALQRVVRAQKSIPSEDCPLAVANLLGFKSARGPWITRVDDAVKRAIATGAMKLEHGRVTLSEHRRGAEQHEDQASSEVASDETVPVREVLESGTEAEKAEQVKILLQAALSSDRPRTQLDQIHRAGRAAVTPLIEALADIRVSALAVTALVEIGHPAKQQLVQALESPDRQVRIHAGEALSRAHLDDDL